MPANKTPARSTRSLYGRTPVWARALVGIAAVAVLGLVVGGGLGAADPASGAGGPSGLLAQAPVATPAGATAPRPAALAAASSAAPAAVSGLQAEAAAGPATAQGPAVPLPQRVAAASAPRRDLSAYEMPADFVPTGADGSIDNAPFARIALADISSGQAAVNALGSHLADVAAWYGKSSAELVSLLLSDRTVHVDRRGRLLHIDDGVAVAQAEAPGEHPAYAGAPLPAGTEGADVLAGSVPSTAGAPFPADQTFALHTRSQSSRVVHLNFKGEGSNPAFDLDKLPGSFSTTEQALIQRIWLRVAEDFAAFDVDITTEAPKTTAGKAGVTILITSRVIGAGGYAYLNAFSALKLAPAPAFCFQNNLAHAEKPIAECLSHEIGHTLGLHHQGTASVAYYGGQGSGETGWAPIMGLGYYKNLTQWAKGEFNGATNQEDAYAVMARQGLSPRADDHGSTAAQATRVAGTVSNGWLALAVHGVIESPGDVDVISFVAGAGKLSLGVTPSAWSPNVDLALELRDAAGKLVASSNPTTLLSASISAHLPATGLYFLSVKGSGQGDAKTNGYSSYGSIGQYAVSGTASIATGVVDDHGSSRELASPVTGLVKNGVFSFTAAGAIGTASDADFFKLVLVAGKLSVQAAPAAGSANLLLALQLQDAAGKVVATSSAATLPGAAVSFNVPAAGTFYLRASGTPKSVAAVGNGLVGQYTIAGSQAVAPPPAVVDDHGNAAAQATALVATVSGGITSYARIGAIEAMGDVDVFKFSMTRPKLSLGVKAAGTAGTLGLVLDLLDANGKLLGTTRVGQTSAAFTLQVPASTLNKTFYLVVKGVAPGDTQAWAMAVGRYTVSGKAS